MAWATSDRAARLPRDWPTIRRQAITRAQGRCQATTHHPRCNRVATEVDHITPGDNHSPTNLQALSEACHKAKTAQESAERNRQRANLRRRTDRHPGQL